MDSDIKQVLRALKQWRKAYQKVRQADPDPETAIAEFTAVHQDLITLLQQDAVAHQVEALLEQGETLAAANLETMQQELRDRPCQIVSQEIAATRPLNLRHKDMAKVLETLLSQDFPHADHKTYDALLSQFPKLHAEIVQQMEAARSLSRKPKKQRKRQITLGAMFTAIGIGLLVANTQGEAASNVYSYILGGNALLKAIRDLVGEVT